MNECIHGLKGRCHDCLLPPDGIKASVYITKGGSAFHNRKDCEFLLEGQLYAKSKGMEVHPITAVAWSLISVDRQPCLNCCPRS